MSGWPSEVSNFFQISYFYRPLFFVLFFGLKSCVFMPTFSIGIIKPFFLLWTCAWSQIWHWMTTTSGANTKSLPTPSKIFYQSQPIHIYPQVLETVLFILCVCVHWLHSPLYHLKHTVGGVISGHASDGVLGFLVFSITMCSALLLNTICSTSSVYNLKPRLPQESPQAFRRRKKNTTTKPLCLSTSTQPPLSIE